MKPRKLGSLASYPDILLISVCVCVKETVQVKNENVMHSWLHFEALKLAIT